jgi:arylsulfatase A-like enzyme
MKYSLSNFFIYFFVSASVWLFMSCGNSDEKLPEQPNVIVFLSDDAGYADFSFNGSKTIKTPFIDELAEKGVLFTNGYVSGPCCSLTRAGLVTGRYQQYFGHETNPGNYDNTDPDLIGLPVNEVTVANLLKDEGYKTAVIGKWKEHDRLRYNQDYVETLKRK